MKKRRGRPGWLVNLDAFVTFQFQATLSSFNQQGLSPLVIPAARFASWEIAVQQTGLVPGRYSWKQATAGRCRRCQSASEDCARTVYDAIPGTTSLWIRAACPRYRMNALNFFGPIAGIPSGQSIPYVVDHVFPRTRAVMHEAPNAVVLAMLVDKSVNSSWGGSFERSSVQWATKCRNAFTLLHVAKAAGVMAPSLAKGRTVHQVARELNSLGVASTQAAIFNGSNNALLADELNRLMRR